MSSRIVWMALALVVAACGSPSEPAPPSQSGLPDPPAGRVRVLGSIIGYNRDDPRISIVQNGRTVSVSVTTYGGGCHSGGETVVQVSGLFVDITPYDFTATTGTVCTQPLLSFVHEATVRFDVVGTAHIRIHGVDARANNWAGKQVVVERTVAVR